jgi:hypothetical protein
MLRQADQDVVAFHVAVHGTGGMERLEGTRQVGQQQAHLEVRGSVLLGPCVQRGALDPLHGEPRGLGAVGEAQHPMVHSPGAHLGLSGKQRVLLGWERHGRGFY